MREGDVLVVAKLDRLARSVADLIGIIQTLERRQVGVRILNLGLDTQTPTGKLMLTVLGAVAQFEREIMLERQREGVAKAKTAGKYKGRKPIASERRQEVVRLATQGMAKATIARTLNLGEATVYRIWQQPKSGLPKDDPPVSPFRAHTKSPRRSVRTGTAGSLRLEKHR